MSYLALLNENLFFISETLDLDHVLTKEGTVHHIHQHLNPKFQLLMYRRPI